MARNTSRRPQRGGPIAGEIGSGRQRVVASSDPDRGRWPAVDAELVANANGQQPGALASGRPEASVAERRARRHRAIESIDPDFWREPTPSFRVIP